MESRLLFTVTPAGRDELASLISHGGACTCPVCTGVGLSEIPVVESSADPAAAHPLSSLPQLHSNAGASAKLFLDFNGNFQASWGGYSNVSTPVYDQDGDASTFSDGELASIQQIWARVAEDYAPFNIDVTTVDPNSQANRVVAHIAIGGNWSDWYGSSAGGVAYIGGFYNSAPNVGYVFEAALGNGNAKYVAEAASHEAGHLFGLLHQAVWSGSTLTQPYNQGNSAWAPIMGTGYYSLRTTWHNGTSSAGPSSYQDDLSILANTSSTSNGFGYRPDDFGSTLESASALPLLGSSVNFSGQIGKYDDVDVWSFATFGGNLTLQLAGSVGSNLDAVLELRNSSGGLLLTASPSNSLGASLSTTVGAGTFYLVARSLGDYGDMGQYTITGSVPAALPPDIDVTLDGISLADGATVDFGTTNGGQSVTRTFTVTNTGQAALSLTALNPAALPTGFTLVSNLGSTSLAAGASTQFSVRLDATTAGSFSGVLQLTSNDPDESPFELSLSGTVLAPEIAVWLSGASVADGQAIDFGSVAVGTSVLRTFEIVNDGNVPLALTDIDPADLPAGFSLAAGLGSTSLAPAESTTFTIQFDGTSAGSFSGSLAILNDDLGENPFDLTLSGAAYIPASEISMLVAGQSIDANGVVDFGSTVTGYALERTFTIRNDGTAALMLAAIDPLALPPGFSLYQDLGSLTLEPGESTQFILRLDAAAAGTFSGTITIGNNDPDEGAFTLGVSGTVNPPAPPYTAIVDDGNAGSKFSGAWIVSTGTTKGYGADAHIAYKGNGSTYATWTFSNLAAGQYQVWATWRINSANATNSPFTIYDNATSRGTTRVNQTLTPSGLSTDGALWQSLSTVAIGSGKLVVKLSNAANNKVVADAIRIQRVDVAGAPVADIGVSANGSELTPGQSTVTFGPRDLGDPQSRTFTVTNHGTGSLQLEPLHPASLPAGFSLAANLGTTYLTPGESTTFAVQLDATAAGTFGGSLSLASSDPNQSVFSAQLSGTVVDPSAPVLRTLDDGALGHTQTGTWTTITGKGFANDIRTAAAGNGSVQSSWSFTNLPDGQYNVWATWKISSVYATNAPYSIYNGNQFVGTTVVNQRLTPSGLWDGTTNWQPLGALAVSGGVLTVRLTNAANGTVVADAVRIEKILGGNAQFLPSTPVVVRHSQLSGDSWAALLATTLASAAESLSARSSLRTLVERMSMTSSMHAAPADPLMFDPRDTRLEELVLEETLELLSVSRSAAQWEPRALGNAADELALASLLQPVV